MALSESTRNLSGIAGETLTVYRFVQLQTDGKYDNSGDGGRIDGIAAESVSLDDAFGRIAPDSSEAKVEAGEAVAVGDIVDSNAAGKAITHVSGGGRHRAGIALTASAADGEIITIQFKTELDEVT